MTRRKKIIVTILVMVLVLPILAIATLGILATLFPSEKHTFTNYQRTAAAHDASQGSG